MGPSAPLITIAIPTFNRAEPLLRQLSELQPIDGIEVLISDDGSVDGTAQALSSFPGIRVIKNETNTGYAANILRLFDEARGRFLMLQADDDRLLVDGVKHLMGWLEQNNPTFISTQYFRGGLYRGHQRPGAIQPRDFFVCSAHAPGLVFNRESAAVDTVGHRLAAHCVAASLYPQVLLACHAIADDSAVWWDGEVSTHGEGLPSAISHDGDPYGSVASRWDQLLAFDDALDHPGQSWSEMRQANAERAFWLMTEAMIAERPDWVEYLEREAKRYSGPSRRRRLARRAISDPRGMAEDLRRMASAKRRRDR